MELPHRFQDSFFEEVIAEVHHEGVVAEPFAGDLHRVGEPLGVILADEAEVGPVFAVERGLHRGLGFGGDHDPDLVDAGLEEVFDGVGDDRLSGDPDDRFGSGVGEGSQPRAVPRGEDQTFHTPIVGAK